MSCASEARNKCCLESLNQTFRLGACSQKKTVESTYNPKLTTQHHVCAPPDSVRAEPCLKSTPPDMPPSLHLPPGSVICLQFFRGKFLPTPKFSATSFPSIGIVAVFSSNHSCDPIILLLVETTALRPPLMQMRSSFRHVHKRSCHGPRRRV